MKIYVGKQTPEHKGDTSRELIALWEEEGLCEIIRNEVEDVFLWANEPNDVLLYEYDRWDVFPGLPVKWRRGLFGGMQHPKGVPWIYWGRHPRQLDAKIKQGIKSFEERKIESIFLGKIENGVQLKNRSTHDWSQCLEMFSMPVQMGDSFKWKYTQAEYLEYISQSKFGLCLPGYGPKCNREIEYLGLGVVPIITSRVDTVYHDPLIEGMHYFAANTPEDVKDIVMGCTKDHWEFMSHHAYKWYERNCSPRGSFETTSRLIQ
jgi:hypothetical protein